MPGLSRLDEVEAAVETPEAADSHRLALLRHRLEIAVICEEFEKAAELRDEIARSTGEHDS